MRVIDHRRRPRQRTRPPADCGLHRTATEPTPVSPSFLRRAESRRIRDLAGTSAGFGGRRGRSLAYSARYEGVGNIWIQPLDGGAPRQWTRWGTEPVFLRLVPDGSGWPTRRRGHE